MAKGIIYIMTTVMDGVVKIGKTGLDSFESRMRNLESNGYRNITGLKRRFAIEVDDYDEKESLIHSIFSKSQISNTECFALDENLAIQLLSAFEGNVIFPASEKKTDIFTEAVEMTASSIVPDGEYTFKRYKKTDKSTVCAKAIIENGLWTLLKGAQLSMTESGDERSSARIRQARSEAPISPSGELQQDLELGKCTPSFAASVVLNGPVNGWTAWIDKNNNPIDIYRLEGKDD